MSSPKPEGSAQNNFHISVSAQTDSSHSAAGLPSHTRFRASHSSPDLQTGVQNHFVFEEALHRCNFKTGETNTVEQRSLLRVNKSCFHHYIHTHRVISTGLLLTRINLQHYCQLCKPLRLTESLLQPHSVHFQDWPCSFGHPLPKAHISTHSSPFTREALLRKNNKRCPCIF